ncbi:MAG: amidohydrolase family protein [Dehalococcoidia bacterium]|nr:amidohydrolase family protein [Dehalococcoidia bacterium]
MARGDRGTEVGRHPEDEDLPQGHADVHVHRDRGQVRTLQRLPSVHGRFSQSARVGRVDARIPGAGGGCCQRRMVGIHGRSVRHRLVLVSRSTSDRPYVEHVREQFATDRLMFGSDWPVCLQASSHQRMFDATIRAIGPFTIKERSNFLGGNATRFYRL